VLPIRIRIIFRKLDPDPHPQQSGKQGPDPDPHQSEKQDLDPHQSEKQDSDPHQSEKVEALEGYGILEHWRRVQILS
jgi:hypothetical protein